jgi:tetratricopeptide (TPR) repeat protein
MASLLEVSQTQGQGHEILVVLIHSLLIALVLGFGRVLSPSIQTAKIQPLLSLKILCLGAGLFGLFFWFHTLNPVRADAELAWAQALETFHRNHFSLDAYRRASELAPSSEPNRRVLADALTRWAINHPEDPRGPELLEEASETLRKAIEDSRGLGRSSFDLGKLSLLQALQTSRPESKKLKSQEASLFLDQACLQEPGSSEIWFDRALVDLLLLDNPKEAEIKIQQADLLIQHPFLLAWADQYWIKTQTASHPMLKQQYGQRTLNLYHHIFLASPHNPELQSACRVGEGSVALELGDPTAALSLLLDSIQLFPQKTSWTTLAKLMEIYLLKGDTATAHSYLLQALRVAPEEKRDALRQLLPEGDPEAKPPQS